jgi:4-hydroxy-tetrahydrodipicolinate reductase
VESANLAIGVHGAGGRMGKRLIQLISEDPSLNLAAAVEREGHPQIGEDAGVVAGVSPLGVKLTRSLAATFDVVVDFSLPDGTLEIAEACGRLGTGLVVGTTGFDAAQRQRLESYSSLIPLLISPNMSRAVNLLMKLVGQATAALGSSCDIAIIERHHRTKKDAPSGTALRLAEYASGAREFGPTSAQGARSAARATREIDIHALRLGDSPGEHTVVFGMLGESIELTHRALNRDGFARGALDAAKFLAGKAPRLYSMEDVLA